MSLESTHHIPSRDTATSTGPHISHSELRSPLRSRAAETFACLEREAEQELRSMTQSATPAPVPRDTLSMALAWDLGLGGDELPDPTDLPPPSGDYQG